MTFACHKCGKEFEDKAWCKRKYCSRSCAAKVNNVTTPKRTRQKPPNCAACASPCKRVESKYCSSECFNKHRVAEVVSNWLEGVGRSRSKTSDIPTPIRRYLLEKAGMKCPLCGWGESNPITGRVTLTIDHKNGDSQDYSRENLQVMCYNCHTLTPTFNELNKGNGTRYSTPGQRRQTERKK